MTQIFPVIMCGGSGTRLWPVSRKKAPKQYQPIMSKRTMLQETILRIHASENPTVKNASLVCSETHLDTVQKQFLDIEKTPHKIILEPIGRNTAPVAAIISEEFKDEDEGLILLLPADHHIADPSGFWDAVEAGIESARQGNLVTFGIQPRHAETGYGYIQAGQSLTARCVQVAEFVEKPDLSTAKSYLEAGTYFWNAGIFLFSPRAMISAFEAHAPDILEASRQTLSVSVRRDIVVHLDRDKFQTCRNESIDYAIMEAAKNVTMVCPVSIGWNDIGSWEALRNYRVPDAKGVAEIGDIISINCKNSLFRSDGPMVAAIGLENIIIVATGDTVLVAKADDTQSVKDIVEKLKAENRQDLL